MRRTQIAIAAGVLATVFAASGEITIRSDYPGGNVKVCGIDEANCIVRIAPDLRDTQGRWFHWDFTLRGAAGRKIHFTLPDDKWQYISSLGPEQDQVFTFGCRDERLNAHWNAFRQNWKETQKGSALVYDGKYDIFAGKGYTVQMEKQWAAGFMSSDPWVRTLPNCYLATCCEFGYSLCGGVYSFPAARELGRNMLKALVRTARESEKP